MDPAFRSFNNWKNCRNGSAFIQSKDMNEIARAKNVTQAIPSPNINPISRPKTPNPTTYSRPPQPEQKYTLNFQLISITTIDLSSDKHLPSKIVGIIKEMQGEYNRESRSWVLPYRNYPKLFKTLQQLKDEHLILMPITLLPIDFMCLPDKLNIIEFNSALKPQAKKEPFRIDYSKDQVPYFVNLPIDLQKKLYNFQKIGIEFGIRKCGRLLLADEMGVGKTVQAICISALYKEEWPVLVLCPSSLKFAWRDELKTWLGEGNVLQEKEIQVFKTSKDKFKDDIKFYIISYDLSIRIIDKIIEKNFNFIISDESHYLKNKESKRSQFLIPIMQRCKRLILISGTPILAKPIELYPLLTALRPDVFKSFKEFGPRYCNPQKTYYGMDWSGSSNVKELHLMLSKLMIRRLKKDVLAELPPKKRQKIEIQTDKKVLTQIRVLLNKVKLKINLDDEKTLKDLNILDEKNENENENENNKDNELNCFTKAYFLTGKAKIPGIKEYITYLIDNSCKFLVFAHHIEVLDAIEDEVKHAKISYVRIDGSIANEKRHERVTEFQTNNNCLVAILAITACANGLTLTKASTVVFAELHFTPAIMNQAEDRAHRIGQEHNCVNVHYLFASDTVDEIVFNKLKEKHFVVSSTLDNKATGMNMQDIKKKVGDFEKGCGRSETQKEEDERKVMVDKKMNGTLNEFLKIKDNVNFHDKDMKRSQNEVNKTIKKNRDENDVDDKEVFGEKTVEFKSKITKLCMI